MGHAHVSGYIHCIGNNWCCRCFWLVLSGPESLSSRPCTYSDIDVLEAVCSRASYYFPYTHARSVLVNTTSKNFMDGRTRHSNSGDFNSSLWTIYDPSRLGLGRVRLGICTCVVPD